jgi:predicted nucleic acid-binding protein
MYLVDTNVISEARKGTKANPGVRRFFKDTAVADVYVSAQTIGEIRRGLENIRYRGDIPQTKKLENWLEVIVDDYADKILSFDEECAQVWGRLMSPHPQHPVDKQIAAIALIHDLTLVTRNVDDFRGTGVEIVNPFDE